MLRSVSVENFRSFVGRATVHLRPITILLGRNSAGKSSLTRLFPLLRQSMERGTSAPILWNSTSVDFGRITDVISRQQKDKPLQLTSFLERENVASIGRRNPGRYMGVGNERGQYIADISFTAFLRAGADGKTNYDRFDLYVNQDRIRVDIRGSKPVITVNERRYDKTKYWSNIITAPKQLFPFILFECAPDNRVGEQPETNDAILALLRKLIDLPETDTIPTTHARIRRTPGLVDVNASPPMPFVPREQLLGALEELPTFRGIGEQTKTYIDELADLLLLTYSSSLIDFIGSKVTETMESLSYLGPIRASGNRFYREQELSIDKIDDTGENLATYIGSLSAIELKSFNSILFQSFGVEVRAHPEAGHLSIEFGRPGDERYDNLADVGFGYSQVLPLVAQIHSESRRDRYPKLRENQVQLSAIEQPELHLHPAYQANLADLFVASIDATRKRGKTPVIILETHSEALVSRVGELIAIGRLNSDDVAIHFVDKDEALGASSVRLAEYDSDGDIIDWPLGFFSAR